MDSVTHVVLGGCVGEALAGRKIGAKAIVLGAAAQSLPDIDFIASFWLDPAQDIVAHRGITHSILFVLVAGTGLGLLAHRYLPNRLAVGRWIAFFTIQIAIHIFIDAFNAYGVAWFAPFSPLRISFNSLFVADPFLTIPIVVAFVFLLLSKSNDYRRTWAIRLSLIWCVLYPSYGILNKLSLDSRLEQSFAKLGVPVKQYFTTPTPLNIWLWYIVANTENGSYIGYHSVFDTNESITYEFFPRNDSLLKPFEGRDDLRYLLQFSQGFYTVDAWKDTVALNDLRFGQMLGWRNRRGRFVFHYYLSHPEENQLLVQRGRFTGWNTKEVLEFIIRIRGN